MNKPLMAAMLIISAMIYPNPARADQQCTGTYTMLVYPDVKTLEGCAEQFSSLALMAKRKDYVQQNGEVVTFTMANVHKITGQCTALNDIKLEVTAPSGACAVLGTMIDDVKGVEALIREVVEQNARRAGS